MWTSGPKSVSSRPFWYSTWTLRMAAWNSSRSCEHAAHQLAAGLAELPAAEIPIDVVADRDQLFGVDRLVQRHHAVAHHAVARHQDRQHAAVGQRDQLDLLQLLRERRHGRGDPDVARHLHQDEAGALHARADRVERAELVRQAVGLGMRDAVDAPAS